LRLWVLTFLVPSAVLTHVGSNTIPQGSAFSISPGDGILIGASFKHMPRALLPYGPRSRAVHACLSSRCQPSC
jgi:hypothetical protein